MKIFVANTTKQVQQFLYRVPENPKVMVDEIPIGTQKRLYKDDATTPEIDAIISQLIPLGAVRADEVDRTRPFIGLCYSVDKPVKDVTIARAVEHNDDVLEQRGHEIRKQAAVAVNDRLNIEASGHKATTVEFKEQTRRGDDPGGSLSETISVVKDGEAPKAPRRRKAG